uniref:proline-rich protein 35 n=1 Tax=Doryrhamphus excisus TaxID=161450 RepID=UPI0025AEC634|nr:proline-rich protein 35 [Doryrhamphus excisus]XP_057917869.1 proline-rich protein 35 [Doryrhamphus excisus]XP_057917870.1 proline-rich protein 35 [Doryrhamphus excisus]XP_057917871.1 proline-rich protein 35 [Doryrhamphus excisus]
MSKDDACKVTSASKHKERKPKKPHYIPRPWGKPYNYKCFQCPFTCMEKSHLYNHMKYSLCKNSLSLLIESDWPYKKGNILHPDQLRPFQQGLHAAGKDAQEQVTRTEERQQRHVEEEGEDRITRGQEEEEEGVEVTPSVKETSTRVDAAESRMKSKADSELLMSDMLSLEEQLLRARSVEVEAHLKHYKLTKACMTAPGLISDQWRLLTSSTKTKAEGAQSRVSSSIPCYPPPPNLVDYQDPAGLNLSVLGVGYPISSSLFSYINSALPATSVATQTHAQLAQLPFLASAAQLIHPASSGHSDGTLLPPRLYYPFLCEHSFGAASSQSDATKVPKTSTLDTFSLPGFQPKANLWKVPALRPGVTTISPGGRMSPQGGSPDLQAYRLGDKVDGKPGLSLKRTAAPLMNHEAPMEKKPSLGFPLDLLKNIQTASTLGVAPEKLLLHGSSQTRSSEPSYTDHLSSPRSEAFSRTTSGGFSSQNPTTAHPIRDGASESVAVLLSDLSKALQEYKEAERKISNLEKEELPVQQHLWEHLTKIRNELSHIHVALERTARQSDGPLDLSFKRGEQGVGLKDNTTETEEEEEEDGKEDEEEERKAMMLETRKQSLEMLIKMSNAGASVMNTEILAQGALGIRHSPAEALWPNRTTKCEADSSVLLCPDGRSVMFADIPSSSKVAKRPPSIQRVEGQCAPSPLTATEN